jgi:hypothetical protein
MRVGFEFLWAVQRCEFQVLAVSVLCLCFCFVCVFVLFVLL